MKSRYDPETEMNQIGAALRALRKAKFVATHGKWKDELREHEEITGAALLNEATKKANRRTVWPSDTPIVPRRVYISTPEKGGSADGKKRSRLETARRAAAAMTRLS